MKQLQENNQIQIIPGTQWVNPELHTVFLLKMIHNCRNSFLLYSQILYGKTLCGQNSDHLQQQDKIQSNYCSLSPKPCKDRQVIFIKYGQVFLTQLSSTLSHSVAKTTVCPDLEEKSTFSTCRWKKISNTVTQSLFIFEDLEQLTKAPVKYLGLYFTSRNKDVFQNNYPKFWK